MRSQCSCRSREWGSWMAKTQQMSTVARDAWPRAKAEMACFMFLMWSKSCMTSTAWEWPLRVGDPSGPHKDCPLWHHADKQRILSSHSRGNLRYSPEGWLLLAPPSCCPNSSTHQLQGTGDSPKTSLKLSSRLHESEVHAWVNHTLARTGYRLGQVPWAK